MLVLLSRSLSLFPSVSSSSSSRFCRLGGRGHPLSSVLVFRFRVGNLLDLYRCSVVCDSPFCLSPMCRSALGFPFFFRWRRSVGGLTFRSIRWGRVTHVGVSGLLHVVFAVALCPLFYFLFSPMRFSPAHGPRMKNCFRAAKKP